MSPPGDESAVMNPPVMSQPGDESAGNRKIRDMFCKSEILTFLLVFLKKRSQMFSDISKQQNMQKLKCTNEKNHQKNEKVVKPGTEEGARNRMG